MIGKGDIEFYYGILVLRVAKSLANKPWKELSDLSRKNRLDKAINIIYDLLNDENCVQKLDEIIGGKDYGPDEN